LWDFFGGGEEGVYLLEKLEAWYRGWVLFGFSLPFFFLGTNEKNSWHRQTESLTREGQRHPALKPLGGLSKHHPTKLLLLT
jgi:hypothetical protein